MVAIITTGDLPASAQAHELVRSMVDGANAKASRVAPCLTWDGTEVGKPSATAEQLAEARLVLIGAIARWVEAGSGSLQSQTAGPYGITVDTRQRTGFNLWPSEIASLQDICRSAAGAGKAFSIDTAPVGTAHGEGCSLAFGALYCSCGSDIAGEPIYETG